MNEAPLLYTPPAPLPPRTRVFFAEQALRQVWPSEDPEGFYDRQEWAQVTEEVIRDLVTSGGAYSRWLRIHSLTDGCSDPMVRVHLDTLRHVAQELHAWEIKHLEDGSLKSNHLKGGDKSRSVCGQRRSNEG